MTHAPIMIPTLNRKTHLKRCLESLAANTGADQTEVFISVDYPPSKKYRQGYLEVKEYLEHADFSAFKQMHIYYQEKNLGAGGNSAYLSNIVTQRFDRLIFTEDDNEFSPNFLEYINKGLDLFENDKRVIGICAAKDTLWSCHNKNVAFAKLFPAYGYGTWVKKERGIVEDCNRVLLPKRVYGPGKMFRLMKNNLCLFTHYICEILCREDGLFWGPNGNLYFCDSVRSLYMHMTDQVCVVPAVAKSRTWGNDGSGVNMPASVIDPEKEFPIDTNSNFNYDNVEDLRFYEENYRLGDQYMSGPYKKRQWVPIVCYIVLLMCFGKRKWACAIFRYVRRLMKR